MRPCMRSRWHEALAQEATRRTQEELAAALSLSQAQVSRLLTARAPSMPGGQTVALAWAVYRISPSLLLPPDRGATPVRVRTVAQARAKRPRQARPSNKRSKR